MKMNMLKLTTVLGLIISFQACTKVVGDGPLVTDSRQVASFSEIEVNIPGDIIFRQANDYKLEIEAQENIIDVINSSVTNNELVVRFQNDVRVRSHERIRVLITAPDINAIRLKGSGNLRAEGNIQSGNFKLRLSGSGNIDLPNLQANTLDADVSGSGDILISEGEVNSEDLRISGSGSIDLDNLSAKSAKTNTTGSGQMRIKVSETLEARITGSGNVYYKGNPSVSTQITGSGKVTPI